MENEYYPISIQIFKAAAKRAMFTGSEKRIIEFLLKANAVIVDKLTP